MLQVLGTPLYWPYYLLGAALLLKDSYIFVSTVSMSETETEALHQAQEEVLVAYIICWLLSLKQHGVNHFVRV